MNNPKLTIDGQEYEFYGKLVAENAFEKSYSSSIVYKAGYKSSLRPCLLQFEPDLSRWPYEPLVRICSQRVFDILFVEIEG